MSLFVGEKLFSQDISCILNKKSLSKCDSSNYFKIEIVNFLQNDEFFSPIMSGKTLIGSNTEVLNEFNVLEDKLTLNIGFLLQKYYGTQSYSIEPSFQSVIKPVEALTVVFGKLDLATIFNSHNININHQRLLTTPSPMGLQFNYEKDNLFASLWVNWQRFIFNKSNFPEQLLVGNYLNYSINLYYISLKLQNHLFIWHKGGQDLAIKFTPKTVVNNSLSSKIKYLNNSFYIYYNYFRDFSVNKIFEYSQGYGILIGGEREFFKFKASMEYWYAYKYYSPNNFAYYNVLPENIGYFYLKTRRMVTFNLSYLLKKNSYNFLVTTQIFYDYYQSKIQYSYGFYLNFNLAYKNQIFKEKTLRLTQ